MPLASLRRRAWRLLPLLLVLAFMVGSALPVVLAAPAPDQAQAPAVQALDPFERPVVRYADAQSGSDPLRSIAPLYDRYAYLYEIPRKWLPNRTNPAQPEAPDPGLQTDINPGMPGPLGTFEGVNNVNGVLPPDTNGDIGPNHYVQTVNLAFAVYDRAGAKLYGPANINTLWQGFSGVCSTSNDGDPIVLYDHLADRWLISQFALPNYPRGPFYQCIAISQTPDPTGAWWRYQFTVSNTKMNDYPKFGVWGDGYYMTVNQFNQGTLTWGGEGVVVFERDKMLQGQTARMVYFDLYSRDPNLGGMLPSDLDGPAPAAGTPNYFVEVDDDAWGYSPDQLQVWEFKTDWTTPANSTFTNVQNLGVTAFDSNMCGGARNCIPQPGGTKVDAIADRLMYRLQYRNFGSYQTMVVNHTIDVDNTDHAGVRWYELRKSGTSWAVNQQGTYAPDAAHRWMGSVAMNGVGDMALGFSTSSTSIYPSIRYTGRLAADPAGQMSQGEATLFAGTGYQTHSSGRWGDYSMMAVDPTDDCTFWYTTEYYAAGATSAGWQTRIGSFKFSNCGVVAPTPTPTSTGVAPTATPTATATTVPPTATPTATPAPGSTMHVGDLDGVGTNTSSTRWKADVTITVHDASHNPVSGVSVSGSWSAGATGTANCTTAANGTCTVSKTNLARNRVSSVTFTVNSLSKTGFTYQSSANHDPDGDSNGTTIKVNRP